MGEVGPRGSVHHYYYYYYYRCRCRTRTYRVCNYGGDDERDKLRKTRAGLLFINQVRGTAATRLAIIVFHASTERVKVKHGRRNPSRPPQRPRANGPPSRFPPDRRKFISTQARICR